MRSRASVPMAENISAYLTIFSRFLRVLAAGIFLYLQKYSYLVNCCNQDSEFGPPDSQLGWRFCNNHRVQLREGNPLHGFTTCFTVPELFL